MKLASKIGEWAGAAARTQKILYVISRYGLTETAAALGIEVGRRGLRLLQNKKPFTGSLASVLGVELAETLVRLGPTFIKLGQILASRPDIVGEKCAEALRLLLDKVPPIPFSHVQAVLQKELGIKKLHQWIEKIDPTPLGAASLSQVHKARLWDGIPIVLKVQKPGVDRLVRTDLAILQTWVTLLSPLLRAYDLAGGFQSFKEATLAELDFRNEAKHIDRFRQNYRQLFSDADVTFPRYLPELTTQRVIALEPMHGKKLSQMKGGTTQAHRVARMSVVAILEQVFQHGFFHADPHAGNLFFMAEEGKIAFIDLGLVGQLSEEDKRMFLKLLFAVLKRNKNALIGALYELGEANRKTNYKRFEKEIEDLISEVQKKGLQGFSLEKLISKLLKIAKRNHLKVPNRYLLMLRTFLVIEGVAKSLDPTLSLITLAPPIVARSLAKSYLPGRWFKRLIGQK